MAHRPVGARRLEGGRSVAALAPAGALAAGLRGVRLRPVPDQRERAAVLVLDEVREDRRREGGVVEPDLVVLASALLVALDGLHRDLGDEVEGLDLALE